jgi:aspartate ammonia-lyase
MNANEVIAHRALEHLGHERGEYAFPHPTDDVNMGQSTNDVYPTAVKVALHWSAERLLEAMRVPHIAFEAKAEESMEGVKVGRT